MEESPHSSPIRLISFDWGNHSQLSELPPRRHHRRSSRRLRVAGGRNHQGLILMEKIERNPVKYRQNLLSTRIAAVASHQSSDRSTPLINSSRTTTALDATIQP
jgi:hypothetical protein